MQIIYGDLWYEVGQASLLLFTANSTLDARGHLVMGAGAALEAKRWFPELPAWFGDRIREHEWGGGDNYGLLIHPTAHDGTRIGTFQVKGHWCEPASPWLIEHSTQMLAQYIELSTDSNERIAMNFPGIGRGQLSREEVLPIISRLPDNVFVYERAEVEGL